MARRAVTDGPPAPRDAFETLDLAESEIDAPDGSTLYVRPFGVAPSVPVARRIGDRECVLGNRLAAEDGRADRFERVLSLTEEPVAATTHHRPLVDGPGAGWTSFAAAADAAADALRDGETLLVHCSAGVSRSAAVFAAAIAAVGGRTVASTLDEVQAARPHAVPRPTLHELAVLYAAARAVAGAP